MSEQKIHNSHFLLFSKLVTELYRALFLKPMQNKNLSLISYLFVSYRFIFNILFVYFNFQLVMTCCI